MPDSPAPRTTTKDEPSSASEPPPHNEPEVDPEVTPPVKDFDPVTNPDGTHEAEPKPT